MKNKFNWQAAFSKDEWHEIKMPEKEEFSGLDVILDSSYAILGLILNSNLEEILAKWIDCQSGLLQIKNISNEFKNKDLYLIIVCREIPKGSFRNIEKIINDTHGARKIFIEQRERSIEEALTDSGLSKSVTKSVSVPLKDKVTLSDMQLSAKIMEDLEKRNEKTILQNLLDDVYNDEN